jgi:hypothetical protein
MLSEPKIFWTQTHSIFRTKRIQVPVLSHFRVQENSSPDPILCLGLEIFLVSIPSQYRSQMTKPDTAGTYIISNSRKSRCIQASPNRWCCYKQPPILWIVLTQPMTGSNVKRSRKCNSLIVSQILGINIEWKSIMHQRFHNKKFSFDTLNTSLHYSIWRRVKQTILLQLLHKQQHFII